MMEFWHHIAAILPALLLYKGAAWVLGADLVWGRRAPVRAIALLSLALSGAWALGQQMTGTHLAALGGAVVVDPFSLFFALLLVVTTTAVVVATSDWLASIEDGAEFLALLLVAAGSMMLLTQAYDLITIFVALETTSLVQFVLAGIARDDRSSEAGLKYLLTGAVAAAVLLYGLVFLFGLAGTTSIDGIHAFIISDAAAAQRLPLLLAFAFVAAGIGYKMALFPFHGWVPDVYEGAPTPVSAFLSVASKAAGFAVALRLFYSALGGGGTLIATDWAMLFAVAAAASMIFGNTGAILQTNVKRLLGYSSIAQAGNIAVGLAAVAATGGTVGPAGVLFFLGTYTATNLGAFLAVHAISARTGSEEMASYAGLVRRSPLAAGVLALCLVSLTGVPPTAGFIAKVYLFGGAVHAGEPWLVGLVAIAVVNTAVSAFYYLRWVRTMFLDDPVEDAPLLLPGGTQAVLLLAAAGVLYFGIIPAPLIEAAQRAAAVLL